MGLAREAQAWAGRGHMEATIAALEAYEFGTLRGTTMVVREPVGVCALITPWNWPLNQIVCKVAPALAAGCTVVLKPSEIAPISGIIFAEVMEAAGVPKGVFNLVNGTGPEVGQVMAGHPDVDMVSFTGSTRAGIIVAKTAADTVKRVAQELGGKSANIILPDADLETAVTKGVQGCFGNSGQSCDAPTRMLVPAGRHDEAVVDRQGGGRGSQGRRSRCGRHRSRPGGEPAAVRQDPAADRDRHFRRRHPGHRRPRPTRAPQPRLLRAADRVRPRAAAR